MPGSKASVYCEDCNRSGEIDDQTEHGSGAVWHEVQCPGCGNQGTYIVRKNGRFDIEGPFTQN